MNRIGSKIKYLVALKADEEMEETVAAKTDAEAL